MLYLIIFASKYQKWKWDFESQGIHTFNQAKPRVLSRSLVEYGQYYTTNELDPMKW